MTFKEMINNSVESQLSVTETELPPAPVLHQEASNLSCLASEMFSSNSDRLFFFSEISYYEAVWKLKEPFGA